MATQLTVTDTKPLIFIHVRVVLTECVARPRTALSYKLCVSACLLRRTLKKKWKANILADYWPVLNRWTILKHSRLETRPEITPVAILAASNLLTTNADATLLEETHAQNKNTTQMRLWIAFIDMERMKTK